MPHLLVQSKQADGANVTNLTVTPDTGITAGNAIVLAVMFANGSARTISSVQNQSGAALTFSALATTQFSNPCGGHLLLVENAPSGITAVKVTLSGVAEFGLSISLMEWSGLKTSSAADATGKNQSTQTSIGTGTDEISSGSLTPTLQPGVLIAMTGNCSNAAIPNAGTGFTTSANLLLGGVTSGMAGRAEYKDIAATSATAGTFTSTSGGETLITLAAVVLDATGSSSATVTPAPAALTTNGRTPITSAFQNVRIRQVLVNESGQPVASAANITLLVWYGGVCRGAPDVSLNGMTSDANGTTSWSIATGTLGYQDRIFYVAQDSLSFSNYTCARLIPNYE